MGILVIFKILVYRYNNKAIILKNIFNLIWWEKVWEIVCRIIWLMFVKFEI